MATLKLTLDKRRTYSDGRSPLILRLTVKGNSTSMDLGIKLQLGEWDAKNAKITKKHPHHQSLNLQVMDNLLEYERKLMDIENKYPSITATELKKLLLSNERSEDITFKKFADEHIKTLKIQKRFGNAQSYQTATNKVVEHGGIPLKLSQIDYIFIKKFERHLSLNGLSANGIASYMRSIRALLNSAGKMKLYDMAIYPFLNFKIRTQRTISRAESIDSIILIKNLELPKGSDEDNARNVFILIFCLIGISFMDLLLLKKSDIQNDRIVYKRRKTGKLYSIKLTPIVIQIFKEYDIENSAFLLPQFGLDGKDDSLIRHHVNLGLKQTNRYLKRIGEKLTLQTKLTTYVARYSWANIAKSKGYSKDLIAEALGHNYGNSVTGIYLEGYGDDIIDSLNQLIVNLFNEE